MNEYSDTATRILDAAQQLIQTKGYYAISFVDIANIVGIKKPSIIHHFSSKAVLGAAVVRRYSEKFLAQLEAVASDDQKTGIRLFW
jgi:TetR/AcrR family transcriptional repressor of nem operon